MSNDVLAEQITSVSPGVEIEMQGIVPREAEFFQDHFPGFPILPGVLAVDLLRQSIQTCLQKASSENLSGRISAMKAVKFASYLKPGDAWQTKCKLISSDANKSLWKAQLFNDGKSAVSARLEIETDTKS